MKKLLIPLLILIIAMLALPAFAADEPAAGSPQDNACNVGGAWEGKCDWPTQAQRDWAWNCGWYIARAQRVEITDTQVPAWCFYRQELKKAPVLPPS